MESPKLITREVVAEKFHISVVTLMNWAYNRKPGPPGFPRPVKFTNKLLWLESDVNQYIESLSTLKKEAGLNLRDSVSEALTPRKRGRPRKILLNN